MTTEVKIVIAKANYFEWMLHKHMQGYLFLCNKPISGIFLSYLYYISLLQQLRIHAQQEIHSASIQVCITLSWGYQNS
jgi:hypothetical protein